MRNKLRHEDSAKTFDQDMQKKMCLKNKWTPKQNTKQTSCINNTGWDVVMIQVMIQAATWSVANSIGMYGTFWTHKKIKSYVHSRTWNFMAIKSLPLNVHCTTKVGLQMERRYFSRSSSSSHSGKASRRDFTGAVTTLSSFSNRVAVFLSSMHPDSITHLTFSCGHSVFCLKNEKKNYWTLLITTDLKICRTSGNIYIMKSNRYV